MPPTSDSNGLLVMRFRRLYPTPIADTENEKQLLSDTLDAKARQQACASTIDTWMSSTM